MRLFGRSRSLPPPGEVDWIYATFEWFLSAQAPLRPTRKPQLVLPTTEYFSCPAGTHHTAAIALYETLRTHAGLDHWPTRILASVDPANLAHEVLEGIPHHAAEGPEFEFFLRCDDPISDLLYAPNTLDNHADFVAGLAGLHGEFLVRSIRSEPPFDLDYTQHASELGAVFLGFGVFHANSLFKFEQFQDVMTQGHSWLRRGVLDQRSVAYALAIYCLMVQNDPKTVKRHLKHTPAGFFGRAIKHITKHELDRVESLRAQISHPPKPNAPKRVKSWRWTHAQARKTEDDST